VLAILCWHEEGSRDVAVSGGGAGGDVCIEQAGKWTFPQSPSAWQLMAGTDAGSAAHRPKYHLPPFAGTKFWSRLKLVNAGPLTVLVHLLVSGSVRDLVAVAREEPVLTGATS
jgi:hypothetical protein